MKLLKAIRDYKKKRLERKYDRKVKRVQFNIQCDSHLVRYIKIMANRLEVPVYVLGEHLLQLGTTEAVVLIQDEKQKEDLARHLVRDHLLVTGILPEHEIVSKRASRLKNALDYMQLLETNHDPRSIQHVIRRLLDNVGDEEKNNAKPDGKTAA